VVLGRGRLLADVGTGDFIDGHSTPRVRVRTGDPVRLRATMAAKGHSVRETEDARWIVEGATAEEVGAVAAREGIPVLELTDVRVSLEDAYLALTSEDAQFTAARAAAGAQEA
jgi:ABC-2 type transport system ATP-binding protein